MNINWAQISQNLLVVCLKIEPVLHYLSHKMKTAFTYSKGIILIEKLFKIQKILSITSYLNKQNTLNNYINHKLLILALGKIILSIKWKAFNLERELQNSKVSSLSVSCSHIHSSPSYMFVFCFQEDGLDFSKNILMNRATRILMSHFKMWYLIITQSHITLWFCRCAYLDCFDSDISSPYLVWYVIIGIL